MQLLNEIPASPASRQTAQTAPRGGVLTALWLPTDADGRLMRAELARHLNWLKRAGIHGVLALGSTGEFARMTLA